MLSLADCVITVEHKDVPLILLAGEVNYESASRINETFEHLRNEGCLNIGLDCQSVDFIDSSGIGAIVHAAHLLRKLGGSVKLMAAAPQLVHALQVSGFAEMLDFNGEISKMYPEVRRQSTIRSTWQQASLSIPARADMDGTARKRVTEFAESMPFAREQIDDIRLAVGEAVANAIRHGCRDKTNDRLTVRCSGDAEKLVVRISNPGDPFDPDSIPVPNAADLHEGGMGIFFMRSSMDDVSYIFDEYGTTVILTKYLISNGKATASGS